MHAHAMPPRDIPIPHRTPRDRRDLARACRRVEEVLHTFTPYPHGMSLFFNRTLKAYGDSGVRITGWVYWAHLHHTPSGRPYPPHGCAYPSTDGTGRRRGGGGLF